MTGTENAMHSSVDMEQHGIPPLPDSEATGRAGEAPPETCAPSLRSGPSDPDLASSAFERASGELQALLTSIGANLTDVERKAVTTAAAKLVGASHLLGQIRGHAAAQAEFESVNATLERRRLAEASPVQAVPGRCPRCSNLDLLGLKHPSAAELTQMPASVLRASLQTYQATPGTHVDRMRATVDALTLFIGRESEREHQQEISVFALRWQAERDEIEQWLHRLGIDPDEVRAPGGRLDTARIDEIFNARSSRQRMT